MYFLIQTNMRCLVLPLVFVVLTYARTPKVWPHMPMLNGRIVGGTPTTIEDLPYQISLQSYGSHICGGSLIAPNKVLTAAHCTDGSSVAALSVRAGSTIRGSGGTVKLVTKICQHPKYNKRTVDNDVSVLTLSSNLPSTNATKPITLAQLGSSVTVGTLAVVSGWGTTSSGGSLPTKLLKVNVPKVSQEDCRKAYGQSAITDSMTCYGYTDGGKDSCQGDSGGPLAIGQTQVGVVSWGAGCAQARKPGVYADPAAASIHNHINSSQLGSSVAVGTLAVVSGWGTTSQGGSSDTQLRKVKVPKVSQEDCRRAYGQSAITDNMTCYGHNEGGKDSCHGDSGGPLAINRTQVGVISWGTGCAQARKPGVYADPAAASIHNHINSC